MTIIQPKLIRIQASSLLLYLLGVTHTKHSNTLGPRDLATPEGQSSSKKVIYSNGKGRGLPAAGGF